MDAITSLGFEGEVTHKGYYLAELSARICVLAYPVKNGYYASFFPIYANAPPRDLYIVFVEHVMRIAKGEVSYRSPKTIIDAPDQLTLKCLIAEALPTVEKHYADCYFNTDAAAGTPVE